MLDFRINTFLCVCRHLSYTKASEELHITQPAVSQHIHFLENQYHTRLFRMEGKRLSITEDGKKLQKAMQQIENEEKRLTETFISGDSAGRTLSFGVTMTIGEYAIVEPLSAYLKSHSSQRIHVHYGNTAELLSDLKEGKIDFALVEGYFPESEYETELFSREKFLPVCAACHHFKRTPHLLKDLFQECLIVREKGSGTRNILERALAVRNYTVEQFQNQIIVENMHTIIQLLKNDCGISFVYQTAARSEIQNGQLLEIHLDDFSMEHDFTFLWDKGSIFSEENRSICRELKMEKTHRKCL